MRKLILAIVVGLACVSVVRAQDAASVVTSFTGLSTQKQLYITWGTLAIKYLAELYSTVRNGGGLKRIVMAFWFGENLPSVIAKDYKSELQTTPVLPPSTTP